MTASVETENIDSDIGKALEDLAPKIRETPVESKSKGQDVPEAVSIGFSVALIDRPSSFVNIIPTSVYISGFRKRFFTGFDIKSKLQFTLSARADIEQTARYWISGGFES